jgi:hypothetical protein
MTHGAARYSRAFSSSSRSSAARDQECPGGANRNAQPACSSVVQSADAFMKAMGAY